MKLNSSHDGRVSTEAGELRYQMLKLDIFLCLTVLQDIYLSVTVSVTIF